MKNAALSAKKFASLLRKIGRVTPPSFPRASQSAASSTRHVDAAAPDAAAPAPSDPVAVLVTSMLMWEASTDRALTAYGRLMGHVVDFNDLRVCMPQETLELIGQRYPRALDRCQRLRAVLRNIYLREHTVSLASLAGAAKREVKKYIESLEGIVPYASARVLLLAYDTHVIPVDDQLRIQLIEADVVDASIEIPELSNWLSLQVKPGEGAATHYSLQAWIDSMSGEKKGPARKVGPARRGRDTPPTPRRAKAAAG